MMRSLHNVFGKLHRLRNLIARQVSEFNSLTKKLNAGRYVRAWNDWALCFLVYGCAPDDYYQFSFPGKPWRERSDFLTHRRNHRLIRKYNPQKTKSLLHKDAFDARFSEYICRDWCALDQETGDTRLREFLKQHKKAFWLSA